MNIISGAKEQSESLVPEFVEFYVNSTKIFDEKNDFYRDNFDTIGNIDNPYWVSNYGKAFLFALAPFLSLPFILALNRVWHT